MTFKTVLMSAALFAALPLSASLAETPATTGTGGSALSTSTAPNTSGVGRTKPPGSAAGPESSGNPNERTPVQKKDNKITNGICNGCN